VTEHSAPPVSLRSRHTDETRRALIKAARKLFSAQGYHNVGIREFAKEAGVTRGAFYHHFECKEDLLLAVMDDMQLELKNHAARRHRSPIRPDRWTQLREDLQIALDEMMAPEVLQILLIDGPAVLGWLRWREHRQGFGLAAIRKAVETSIADGLITPRPATELAHLISASFNEASLLIAYASDPDTARVSAGNALDALLEGLLADKAASLS